MYTELKNNDYINNIYCLVYIVYIVDTANIT